MIEAKGNTQSTKIIREEFTERIAFSLLGYNL